MKGRSQKDFSGEEPFGKCFVQAAEGAAPMTEKSKIDIVTLVYIFTSVSLVSEGMETTFPGYQN